MIIFSIITPCRIRRLESRDVITVATWNVLHRIHGENWDEDVAVRWPQEQERIAAVTARLKERPEQVIALQEVSGDQLTSLRASLAGPAVHAFRYPRVPAAHDGTCPLRDPAEYLVLLTKGPGLQVAAWSSEDDPGKGALAVQAAGAVFVTTHVSLDGRRARQLKRLAGLAADRPGQPIVLLGDFNTDRATVAAGLGDGFTVAAFPPDSPPTRPGASRPGLRYIDHVVVQNASVTGVAVEDADGLSDHNLVRATVTW